MFFFGVICGFFLAVLIYGIFISVSDYKYRKARPAPLPFSSIRHLTSEQDTDGSYSPSTLSDPLIK